MGIPGKNISYSDHEGVAAKISIKRNGGEQMTSRDFVRLQSCKDIQSKRACVEKGIVILNNSLRSVKFARLMYLLSCVLCLVLLIDAFIPTAYGFIWVDVGLFFIRLCLIVVGTYLFLMSVLFFRKERHALNGTIACLQLLLDNSNGNQLTKEEGEVQQSFKQCVCFTVREYSGFGLLLSEYSCLDCCFHIMSSTLAEFDIIFLPIYHICQYFHF